LWPIRWAQRLQPGRQGTQALGCPQQRRLGVTPGRRLDQTAKVIEQRGIARHKLLAPAARTAHPASRHSRAAAQFRHAATDRAARHAGDPPHQAHPAAPRRQCLGGCEPTTPALVQHWIERLVAKSDRRLVTHLAIL
jgi:hypothetical protein